MCAMWYFLDDQTDTWQFDRNHKEIERSFRSGSKSFTFANDTYVFGSMIACRSSGCDQLISRQSSAREKSNTKPWLFEVEVGEYGYMNSDISACLTIVRQIGYLKITLVDHLTRTLYDFDLDDLVQINRHTNKKRHILPAPLAYVKIDDDPTAPDEFICPITKELMTDPVTTADGHTYERSAIEETFVAINTKSPLTGKQLISGRLYPNIALKNMIQNHVQGKRKKIEDNVKLAGVRALRQAKHFKS